MLGAKEILEVISEKDTTTRGSAITPNRLYWVAPGHSYVGGEATPSEGEESKGNPRKEGDKRGVYTSR